ncbi:MAG: hypothetical protein LCH61_15090 [Proteobacteria bacterium]|nr:hypothetical protein [Pseudomonadota bacterium]
MLKRITIHLARTKAFPNGSFDHGYTFVAPLDSQGHIDADAWHDNREACTVTRFWGGEEEDLGHLVRRPGGSWAFHYDVAGDEDDEAGYRFGAHVFREREYVSLKDQDGDLQPFIVASVEDA